MLKDLNRMDYVYIMGNESMPGIYKIGRSQNPEKRVCELSRATCVPTPFYLVATFAHPSAQFYERDVHIELSPHRVSVSREFFCGLSLDRMQEKMMDIGEAYYENYELQMHRIDAFWTDPIGGPRIRQHFKQLGISDPKVDDDHADALVRVLEHIWNGTDLFKRAA